VICFRTPLGSGSDGKFTHPVSPDNAERQCHIQGSAADLQHAARPRFDQFLRGLQKWHCLPDVCSGQRKAELLRGQSQGGEGQEITPG